MTGLESTSPYQVTAARPVACTMRQIPPAGRHIPFRTQGQSTPGSDPPVEPEPILTADEADSISTVNSRALEAFTGFTGAYGNPSVMGHQDSVSSVRALDSSQDTGNWWIATSGAPRTRSSRVLTSLPPRAARGRLIRRRR